jgi:L-ascorbate 6-phosphate lactonase
MPDIALAHADLLADIRAARPEPGRACFWWQGQHSFIVKVGQTVIYIDPFLEPMAARQTPPTLRPEEVTNADLVLVTHDHADHLNPCTLAGIAQASDEAIFLCPRTATSRMTGDAQVPAECVRPINAGETASWSGLKVTAIKSKHEFFDEDPELGFPYLGYVVEAGGVAFYHSGDTVNYEGLISTLRQWPRLDAIFIPINGRDALRYRGGCIGNMTYQEAVDFAGELKPGLVVPTHYDMFRGNQEDPQRFADYLEAKYPDQAYWIGRVNERVEFGQVV